MLRLDSQRGFIDGTHSKVEFLGGILRWDSQVEFDLGWDSQVGLLGGIIG